MIEREFIKRKHIEYKIKEFIKERTKGAGYSHAQIQRTPLGEKIIIYATRPGLVVGRGGKEIKSLTEELKKRFGLENPQVELGEIENPFLDPMIVVENITSALEKFGTTRFKGIGHKMISNIMAAGALGAEIRISGKVPSTRARSWRFYAGYLKKCGDIAISGIREAKGIAKLKSGVIGVQVRIMPPDIKLIDKVALKKNESEGAKKDSA